MEGAAQEASLRLERPAFRAGDGTSCHRRASGVKHRDAANPIEGGGLAGHASVAPDDTARAGAAGTAVIDRPGGAP
jgi:hypothetical protein